MNNETIPKTPARRGFEAATEVLSNQAKRGALRDLRCALEEGWAHALHDHEHDAIEIIESYVRDWLTQKFSVAMMDMEDTKCDAIPLLILNQLARQVGVIKGP